MHGDHFVPNSAEFTRVSDSQFVAFVRLDVVVLVVCHVLHAEPKLLTWRSFLLFGVFNCILVIYPKIVIFEQGSSDQLFVIVWRWHHLLDAFLVGSHCFKVIEVFLYYIITVSF